MRRAGLRGWPPEPALPSGGLGRLEASENIAACQDDIGDDDDPEAVLGDERYRHEGADDAQDC